jgi:HD superfamily phosphodiesterase
LPPHEGDTGSALSAAFDDVAAQLERRDAMAAARAVARLVAACDAVRASGQRLDAATLADLDGRLRRCVELAAKGRDGLAATLRALGNGHRAHRAYQQDG